MGLEKDIIITYEPDNSIRNGYLPLFREIFLEIWNNRWLTYQLFKREFLSLYKQSFIGILWIFIVPVISVGTFVLLNRSGVFTIGDVGVPYPVYAMLGISFWQLFAAGLVACSNSLVKAGQLIVKINFSKKSLVIASIGQSIVAFLIQFALAGALFIFYGISPSVATVLVPVVAIPILLLSLGLGFIFAIFNGIVRDIGNLLSIFITFLMFLTPVLYAKPSAGILVKITRYNPLYYLVALPRDLVLRGSFAEWGGFFYGTILSVVIFVSCLFVFHLTESRVTERI